MSIRNRIRSFPGPLVPPSGATKYVDLTDKATADLPSINGPLGDALDLKANTADLGGAASLDVGTTAGTVAAGDDARFTDSREWSAATVAQADAEAGTATDRKAWSAQRVWQAIAAWASSTLGTAAYTASTDYATANQGGLADTAVQPGDLATVAFSAGANDLTQGTLDDARLSANVVLTGDSRLTDARYPILDSSNSSTGGNGATDSGKVATFDANGGLSATAATSGTGLYGESASGIGVEAYSVNGTGAKSVAVNGSYHHEFGDSGDTRSFVARLKGAFGWWRGLYNLTISAVDTLTANRVQRFQDKDGTIALTSDITGTNSGTNTGDETGTRIAALITAATSKATPVDDDEFGGTDSAASYGFKKFTWSNIKATLKTYFDTLYVALSGNQTVAGNKTFSGQLELTGQAATNGTSAMTRDLLDARLGKYVTSSTNRDRTTQNVFTIDEDLQVTLDADSWYYFEFVTKQDTIAGNGGLYSKVYYGGTLSDAAAYDGASTIIDNYGNGTAKRAWTGVTAGSFTEATQATSVARIYSVIHTGTSGTLSIYHANGYGTGTAKRKAGYLYIRKL